MLPQRTSLILITNLPRVGVRFTFRVALIRSVDAFGDRCIKRISFRNTRLCKFVGRFQ